MQNDELDRMLAERVMGWHMRDDTWAEYEESGVLGYAQEVPAWTVDEWTPTADIAQAFAVAKKAGYLTLTQGSVAWDAHIESSKGSGSAFHVTPALAICMAAQRWLEVQKPLTPKESHTNAQETTNGETT